MNRCKIKLLTFLVLTVVFVSWEVFALPCNYYDSEQLSAMPDDEVQIYLQSCSLYSYDHREHPRADDIAFRTELNSDWTEDKEATGSEFWEDWAGDGDSPFLINKSASTFYGLGAWIPKKYDQQEIDTIQDAQKWLRNHGLQMSFGVGGEDRLSPRFRVDYRWHQDEKNDLFLQVEIPFQ
ncbi:hypothetical protein [Photobacterium sp.]|uniref:hypothetical protein n=1 Tax=Photobacterium sp. TaxID=660 RepID=UPI00299DA0DB|nr:hypothetical protein [Photobacterium sp.]MDX1302823.1 hypothetical protein [Photobacterium sp.]